jgi:hypothetical protein
VEPVAGARADALDGGALRARWSAAVLAEPEGAPATAAAGSEDATVRIVAAVATHDPSSRVKPTTRHGRMTVISSSR